MFNKDKKSINCKCCSSKVSHYGLMTNHINTLYKTDIVIKKIHQIDDKYTISREVILHDRNNKYIHAFIRIHKYNLCRNMITELITTNEPFGKILNKYYENINIRNINFTKEACTNTSCKCGYKYCRYSEIYNENEILAEVEDFTI